MRIVLIALSVLLLLGCIRQPPENPPPASYPANASASSQPPPAQNITPGESVINESNITARNASTGSVSNLSNGTLPPAPLPDATTNATVQRPALPFGNYSLVLDDVSVIPSSSEPCGIFSITAVNGSIADRFVVCPRQSRTWIAPDGHAYRIFVKKVAAGYGGVEWADVTIFG
jgi:hypothetical protein